MSDHADIIRESLESDWMYGGPGREVFAALDALDAENQRLRDALKQIADRDFGGYLMSPDEAEMVALACMALDGPK